MSPFIADLLWQTNREPAGTDARVDCRLGEQLKRTGAALRSLQEAEQSETAATKPLLRQSLALP